MGVRSGLARYCCLGLCSVLWITYWQEDSLATRHLPLITALYCRANRRRHQNVRHHYYRGLERLRQLAREMTRDEGGHKGGRKGEEG